jgi:hypothetical protein
MQSFVCGAIMALVAFATYTQFRKSKDLGDANRARLWMIGSIIAGVIAVVTIAGAIAG